MKLEIRKKEEPSGDVYYQIYTNDKYQESFFCGSIHQEGFNLLDKRAYEKAKKVYDSMVAFASDTSKVTVIESTEI